MVWRQPLAEPRVHAVPTRSLLLIESESPQWLQRGAEGRRSGFAARPDVSLEVLREQQQLAAVTAPERFAQPGAAFVDQG